MQIINIILIFFIIVLMSILYTRLEKFKLFDNNKIQRMKVLKYNKHVKKHGELSRHTGGGGHKDKSYQGIIFFDSEENNLIGQRDPKKRLKLINKHLSFKDKSVLDIGCNSGEILFSLQNIKFGVGVDFDPYKINMCNLIKRYNKSSNLDFFNLDLKKENYEIMTSFFPKDEYKVDIVFLLALCQKWIYPCTNLINYIYNISDTLIIEINGESIDQKNELIEYLNKLYDTVIEITDNKICDDCHNRRLFIAQDKKPFSLYNLTGKSIGQAKITFNKNNNTVNKTFKIKEIYKKEKSWLIRLQKFSFTPVLLSYDDNNMVLTMKNSGERINQYNKPIDFDFQLKNIKLILEKENIFHNDLTTVENILVKPDSTLCIIDFEWTSNTKENEQWDKFKGKDEELRDYMSKTTLL